MTSATVLGTVVHIQSSTYFIQFIQLARLFADMMEANALLTRCYFDEVKDMYWANEQWHLARGR